MSNTKHTTMNAMQEPTKRKILNAVFDRLVLEQAKYHSLNPPYAVIGDKCVEQAHNDAAMDVYRLNSH
jgi:hypothetical protein